MSVNKVLWMAPLKRHYTSGVDGSMMKNVAPDWHCPSCKGGYLKQKPESINLCETSESRQAHTHEAWEPEWDRYRFTMLLICDNPQCQESVAVTGEGKSEIRQTSYNSHEQIYYLYPLYVSPSPMLITADESYPELVNAELRLSFIASWSDYSAAGNHIRIAVERLLDHLNEPKERLTKNGETVRIPLGERIKKWGTSNEELASHLTAVKWIGNEASHSDTLTRDNIFDALDILDIILGDIFVKHRSRIKKLVESINREKGIVKK